MRSKKTFANERQTRNIYISKRIFASLISLGSFACFSMFFDDVVLLDTKKHMPYLETGVCGFESACRRTILNATRNDAVLHVHQKS